MTTTTTTTTLAPTLAKVSQPSVRELRHRAEVPSLIMAGLLTLGGLLVASIAAVSGISVPAWATAAVVGLGTPIAAGLIFIRFLYWKSIANGVEITEHQLPDIHAIYQDLISEMEIQRAPRLYLANGNGEMNAFAAKCQVRRSFVVIWSDLLDIAYEHGDFNGVKFVLAHELGHIKCGHVNLWRQAIMAVPRAIFFGRTVVRAQEYTADRCGAYYAPEGAQSLMALLAGKRMYRHCNISAYQASVRDHDDGFWLKVVNFFSDHAVGYRRMQPLLDIETQGWDQHGKMM